MGTVNAQIESKINPLGLLYKSPDVSIEVAAMPKLGIEGKFGYTWGSNELSGEVRKVTGILMAKYYFKADSTKINRFYAGVYTKYANSDNSGDLITSYTNERFALGLLTGYKWVLKSNIVFDLNVGIGRAMWNQYTFTEEVDDLVAQLISLGDFDGISSISIGYRF